MAMKISLDVSAVPRSPAGAGRYIIELAQRLDKSNLNLTLVSQKGDAQRWREGSPESVVADIIPKSRPARLLYERFVVGRVGAPRTSDVWHSPHYSMPRGLQTATVVTIHDLTYFTNPEWHQKSKVQFFKRSMHYAAEHADVLIAVSEFTAEQMKRYIPTRKPVIVAPHGVDLEHFSTKGLNDDELTAPFRNDDVPYIFFVGTLEPRKGLDFLLDAFASVASTHPELELWIAGQRGWGKNTIDERLTQHPFASRIRPLGYVDNEVLPALFRQASVVAYPSRGEGFGLPVLEALACGAVVVTSEGTVMEEVAGDAAMLVRVGDIAQLAEALNKSLHLTNEQRAEVAHRARLRSEVYTWDVTIDRHLEAYDLARSEFARTRR
jgi:glycosyltransferase involved in cell wall biosynthesis